MHEEDIQSQMNNICQQKDKLNGELYELWKVMKISKRRYKKKKKQTMNYEKKLTVKDCEGEARGALQYKAWNPRISNELVNGHYNISTKKMQNIVWDHGGINNQYHMTRRS